MPKHKFTTTYFLKGCSFQNGFFGGVSLAEYNRTTVVMADLETFIRPPAAMPTIALTAASKW